MYERENLYTEGITEMCVCYKIQVLNYPNTNFYCKATRFGDQSNYYAQSFVNHYDKYIF